jgi:hypothetical protein
VPLARAEELVEASPRAELRVIDTPSHMLPLTHAAALVEMIYGG